MTTKTPEMGRNARLEARVPSEQKDFFQRAATLAGKTLSEFVVESTQAAANRVVQEQEFIQLSRDEQVAFVTALLTPSEPGARLREAVESYKQKAGI